MKVLADRLRSLRESRGLTQREVGDAVGVAPSTIGMYEGGMRVPDPEMLIRLATFYGVTTDYLLGRDNDLTPDQKLLQLGAYLRSNGATEEDVKMILQFMESRRRILEGGETK